MCFFQLSDCQIFYQSQNKKNIVHSSIQDTFSYCIDMPDSEHIGEYLIPKTHVGSDHILVKFNIEKEIWMSSKHRLISIPKY